MKALKFNGNIERRIENRYTCSEEIFFATHSRLYEGELIDYCRNSLFIKTKEILPIGEIITVVVHTRAEGMRNVRVESYGKIRKDSE